MNLKAPPSSLKSKQLTSHHSAKSERGVSVFTIMLLLVSAGILTVGLIAFTQLTHTNPISANFLEEDAPALTWHEQPRGLGAETVNLALTANDTGAGLDEVVVRVIQNNQPRDILRKTFGSKVIRNETIDVALSPKELGLREGNAELQVLAFDKALWSNGARLSTVVEVNYLKPQITPLTPQQNGVLGGTELVFYKVTGKPPDTNGVLAQGTLYPGFKAAGWSDKFKSRTNTYMALYPMPASFNIDTDKMQVAARDNLGNAATASFNYRIKQRRWGSFRVALNTESATKLRETLAAYAEKERITYKSTNDLANDLKALLKAIALSDEGFIGTALDETSDTKLWKDAFLPPVSSSPNNSAGDTRVVYLDNNELVRGTASGVRFPVSKRVPVVAANSGKVTFIGTLGMLGNTIVIDHGFGIATIYGHLSGVNVQRGAKVERGSVIGQTGTTGFSQSEEVYFELRVHGVSVSPNEWWDQSWVTDHIDNKVAFVLRSE